MRLDAGILKLVATLLLILLGQDLDIRVSSRVIKYEGKIVEYCRSIINFYGSTSTIHNSLHGSGTAVDFPQYSKAYDLEGSNDRGNQTQCISVGSLKLSGHHLSPMTHPTK